jgi:hypothetical protein
MPLVDRNHRAPVRRVVLQPHPGLGDVGFHAESGCHTRAHTRSHHSKPRPRKPNHPQNPTPRTHKRASPQRRRGRLCRAPSPPPTGTLESPNPGHGSQPSWPRPGGRRLQ